MPTTQGGVKAGAQDTDWLPFSYNTTSNLTRIVKTPGGKLRTLHIKKRGTAPKCGDCHKKLPGVSQQQPARGSSPSDAFLPRHGSANRTYR